MISKWYRCSCGFSEDVFVDEISSTDYWWTCSECGSTAMLKSRLQEPVEKEEELGLETRDIPWAKGYVAGADGNIYRVAGGRMRKLNGSVGSSGYRDVWLYVDGNRVTKGVHRLVCEAWHGEPGEGDHARHLDGDRTNNTPENLAWGSRSDNMQDAIEAKAFAMGEKHLNAKLTEDDVRQIREKHGPGVSYSELADEFDVSRHTVADIIKGRSWKHVE